MDNASYITNKLNWANGFIKNTTGLKPCYLENDIFTVLTKFGWIEVIDLDEARDYLPTKGYNFDSIGEFTKGFITNHNYKIYAVRMGHHFNLFVVAFNEYKEACSYYSVNISEETMDIIYILEMMTQNVDK